MIRSKTKKQRVARGMARVERLARLKWESGHDPTLAAAAALESDDSAIRHAHYAQELGDSKTLAFAHWCACFDCAHRARVLWIRVLQCILHWLNSPRP